MDQPPLPHPRNLVRRGNAAAEGEPVSNAELVVVIKGQQRRLLRVGVVTMLMMLLCIGIGIAIHPVWHSYAWFFLGLVFAVLLGLIVQKWRENIALLDHYRRINDVRRNIRWER